MLLVYPALYLFRGLLPCPALLFPALPRYDIPCPLLAFSPLYPIVSCITMSLIVPYPGHILLHVRPALFLCPFFRVPCVLFPVLPSFRQRVSTLPLPLPLSFPALP